jgi:glycerophosphoryl diester phosphodiesterase
MEHAFIIAFDHGTLRAAKAALPRATALHLAGGMRHGQACTQADLDALIAGARTAHFDGLNLGDDWSIDATLVQRVHEAGLLCHVWTVNDPARARFLADAGVDGIATDRPGWIRRHLAADSPA